MNIKRNIIFTPESRKKDGLPIVENVPIRMRVIFGGKRIDFTTGYRIDVAKWDYEKQRVKNGSTNKLKQSSSEINADINNYESIIQSIFKEYEVANTLPTPAQIRLSFNERIKASVNEEPTEEIIEEPVISFWELYDEFVKENGRLNNWTHATFQKFKTVNNHLTDFRNYLEHELSFDFFSEDGLNDYVDYLRNVEDMRNVTIGKQISFLKWFLRWSARKGYHSNMAFDSFKPKLKSTQKKVIFLTTEELTRLRDVTIPSAKQYLERVRDIFLFLCFSGLRYSDIANLKRSDIKAGHIEVTTMKTADSLSIELNAQTKSIIEKYKDIQFKNDRVLPIITNQKFNVYLKELGQLAGIDEPIRETFYKGNERIDMVTPKYVLLGSHAGRRTFICNALALGIPPHVVMKWTGHSDYKAMKPYIDIADNIKAQAMTKFDNLLGQHT
ncbi:site-specific integrase [Parabacteroides chinchillae]|uniref:Site-specific recombinase XerD n=1 Tax=Parabacteroides chinchillae TaxID=871327 RepID=A0A8G2BXD7_9BACT|nr:site-specific integrase [Parabacteroides chinchillae]SEG01687.1 Site-specific recombinase XerD [Parabacteroides chinchillae]